MGEEEQRIKRRMNERLGQLRWSLVDLSDATDESYRNVHRWIREEVKVPAHFVSRFAETVPVSTRWLLTGEGTPDPVKESAAKRALERIAHVLDTVRLTSSTGVLAESVIQSSVDGILTYDREFRLTLWNPAVEDLTGVPAMEVLGRIIFQVLPFLERDGEDQPLRATLRGGAFVTRDRRYEIPESGRSGWYEGHHSPLRDISGDIVGGLCVLRDVTERTEALMQLRESEERHRKLMELNPDAVLVQIEGEIVYANAAMEELMRCREDGQLQGRSIRSFIPDEEWEWREEVIRQIEEGFRTGPLERTLTRCDGTPVDVTVRAVGVTLEGKPGTQAVIRRRGSDR